MSVSTPLLDNTIEADEPEQISANNKSSNDTNTRQPVVLTPINRANDTRMATNQSDAESGIAGIFRQSTHPFSLFFLYFFRIAAITVYLLAERVVNNYVLSTVLVVVLLAMDFWNCRNVAGRTLVGLRFWNQVDDDGESYWVFESRDPSRPANPVDSRMFWIAIYTFPLLWVALFLVCLLYLNVSYLPIVILALVFNITNAIGFTYADRDSKQRWANQTLAGGWGIGGIGGSLITGAVQKGVGRLFS